MRKLLAYSEATYEVFQADSCVKELDITPLSQAVGWQNAFGWLSENFHV